MSEQEVVLGGLRVRRQFERSRLEQDLFEAVYDALLLELPQEFSGRGSSEPLAKPKPVSAGVAA